MSCMLRDGANFSQISVAHVAKLSQEILHLSGQQASHMQWFGALSHLQKHQGLRQTCLQYFSKLVQWSSLWLKFQDCFDRHVSATTKKQPLLQKHKTLSVSHLGQLADLLRMQTKDERMNSKGNERFTYVKRVVKRSKKWFHDKIKWHQGCC